MKINAIATKKVIKRMQEPQNKPHPVQTRVVTAEYLSWSNISLQELRAPQTPHNIWLIEMDKRIIPK